MKATINSEKHYVHTPVTAVASGVRSNVTLVDVDNQLSDANDVRVGAIVKAVYVEMWADSATASKTVNACITKIVSNGATPSFAEMANMGSYGNKKNVLEFHQGLAPSNGNIIPLFRQWVMIPKGKQRFGLGDALTFSISATGASMNFCGFTTFKEYY